MKKTAIGWAKASYIISIVVTSLWGVLSIIRTGDFIIASLDNKALLGDLTKLIAAYSNVVSGALGFVFSKKLMETLKTAKSKNEIIPFAVLTMIFGFLPAGIIALCIPNKQFEGADDNVSYSSGKNEEVMPEVMDDDNGQGAI